MFFTRSFKRVSAPCVQNVCTERISVHKFNLQGKFSQALFKTEMSISVRISKYDFQHSRLIFPGKYFVKFPVNLLKPNPQSRASILSSLESSADNLSRGIFQIPFSPVSSGNGILLKELPKVEDLPQSKWTFLI